MSQVFGMTDVPAAADYVRALTELGSRVKDSHKALFRIHYHAPSREATARQLAARAGLAGPSVPNALYGNLGHAVADLLDIEPPPRSDNTHQWWAVWSRGRWESGSFVWQMLPQVAEALELLGWAGDFMTPDEVTELIPLVEGAVYQVTVNAYERSREARRQCIEAHGTICCICGFDFGAVYGPEFEGYIHVHHLRPLSEIAAEHKVDPVVDMRPVCPNCHAALHLGRHRDIEEVRELLTSHRPTGTNPG